MVAFVFALLGLVVGSFLNVVIIRHREKGLGGRSGCMSCLAQLTTIDLIPIVSWAMLRGRCRQCGSKISIQYPIVEAVTAVLFGLYGFLVSQMDLDLTQTVVLSGVGLCVISFSIIITVYDIRHTIIPDRWSFSLLFCGLLWVFVENGYQYDAVGWSLLAAIVCSLPFAALWLVSRGRWMGLGDAKLALGIGAILGIEQGITALLLAFWIGAILSVSLLIVLPRLLRMCGVHPRFLRHYTLKSEIPFGPFLTFSCILVWYLGLYGTPLLIPGIALY